MKKYNTCLGVQITKLPVDYKQENKSKTASNDYL